MAGVSSRTRSKNVSLFGCLPPKSKRRRKSDEEPFVIFIDGDDDGDEDMYFDSASDSKNMKLKDEPFVIPEGAKVISIDEDDYGDEDEEGSVQQCVDVEKEEKSVEFAEKDENFVGEKSGCDEDNPISIHSDEYDDSDEEHYGSDSDAADADEVKDGVKSDADVDAKDGVKMDADDGAGDVKDGVKSDEVGGNGEFYDKDKSFIDLGDSDKSDGDDSDESEDSDSDESEEIETSDEDFRVDEMNEVFGNGDDSSSSSSYVNEKQEEEEEEEVEKKKTGGPKYYTAVEELVREVMDRQSGISERNNEEVNVENSSSYHNDEEMVSEVKGKKSGIFKRKYEEVENVGNSPSATNIDELEHADHASVSSCTIEKKGSSSSKPNGVSVKPKSVEGKVKNLSDESVNIGVNAKSKNKSKENVGDSDRGKDQFVKGLDVGGVSSVQKKQEEMKFDAVDRRDRQPPPVPVENDVLWDELETILRELEAVCKVIILFKNIKI